MKNALCAMLLPLLLVGCVAEKDNLQVREDLHEVVFHAGWAPETKTVLQEDGSVWWSPGDEISLFVGDGGNGGYKLTSNNTEPAPTVNFAGQISGIHDNVEFVAIYPYNEGNRVDGNSVFFTIPTEQIAKKGTFADGALVSVAVSSNENLFFKNLCSGIKFSVAKDNVNKIVIKAVEDWNKLSGQFETSIDPDTGEPSSFRGGVSPNIVVIAPDSGCFSVGAYYYASIIPGTISGGIVVEYYTSDNKVGTLVSEWVPMFNRAVVKSLYEKDRYLQFHPVHESSADFYPSSYPYTLLPENVDKTTITNVSFVVNSNITTDIAIPSSGAPIYFEMKGTTATYYTSAEIYNLLDGSDLFNGWTALEEADLSMIRTDRVRSMTRMFSKCKKLRSVDLSSFNTDNVRTMTAMFEACKSLKHLDISNFSSLSMVGEPQGAEGMFDACYDLLKLDMGNFDLSVCGTSSAIAGVAKYSKNCAIRCSSATRAKLSEDSGLGVNSKTDYITWVLPEEDIPDLEPIVDPSVYTSTDYSKDKTVRILHKASKGNGVDIVLLGDAYSDRMIEDGTYDADMELAMNAILKDEPYASFKDYINVYTVYAVSESEIPYYTRTVFDAAILGWDGDDFGTAAIVDNDEIYRYASIAFPDKDLEDVAMILVINQAEGECNSFTDGLAGYEASWSNEEYLDYAAHARSIGMINRRDRSQAETFSQIVAHEFGHVFAKLGDEYIMIDGEIADWEREFIIDSSTHVGWWSNLDVTSDPKLIKWKRFMEDERYAGTGIGIYDGGYTYALGVWHPTENSIMRYNQGMFNVPSREVIYKRIHKLALGKDWEYNFETFVEYDQKNIAAEKAAKTVSKVMTVEYAHPKPVFKIDESVVAEGKKKVTVIMN